MGWLHTLFGKIGHLFSSTKAQAVEAQIATLTQEALPIVQEIAALCPNKTVQEITSAFTKFGMPLANEIAADPTSTGNALLNLATGVMQQKMPTAAMTLLNTAVQLAVVAIKVQ